MSCITGAAGEGEEELTKQWDWNEDNEFWKSLTWVPMDEEDEGGVQEFNTKSVYVHGYCMEDNKSSYFAIPIADLIFDEADTVFPKRIMDPEIMLSENTVGLPGGRILSVGGRGVGVNSEVWVYDINDRDKGLQKLTNPSAVTAEFVGGCSAVTVEGKVYFFGGRMEQPYNSHSQVDILDTIGNDYVWESFWYDDYCLPSGIDYSRITAIRCLFKDSENHKHLLLHCRSYDDNFSIHAFNLDSGEIRLAKSNFRLSQPLEPEPSYIRYLEFTHIHGAVAVDKVLYTYTESSKDIRGYDLVKKEWIPGGVIGLDFLYHYDSPIHLLHIGGKRLCLINQYGCAGGDGDGDGISTELRCTVVNVIKKEHELETNLVASILSSRFYNLQDNFLLDCGIIDIDAKVAAPGVGIEEDVL